MEIPVILFAYARPSHLRRVLECLQKDRVPLILAYADAPRTDRDVAAVQEVRAMLRSISWCKVQLVERRQNFGLGRNVIAGVTEAAQSYPSFVVWEDDLIAVPGTYQWMCSALYQYQDEPNVGSISAWTHPRITPRGVTEAYFDGRADCWVWGSWSRAWSGMETETALSKMKAAERRGIRRDSYGSDLPQMAKVEVRKNIWAVRWLYHHLQHDLLCLRPGGAMVEHIGFGPHATNALEDVGWGGHIDLSRRASMPAQWPPVTLNLACQRLWRGSMPSLSFCARVVRRMSRFF